MEKIGLEISESLLERLRAVGKKTGRQNMSDELVVLEILIDGLVENEKIMKMMEDND